MAEEKDKGRREQPAGRSGSEQEGWERVLSATPGKSWSWTRPLGGDEPSPSSAELSTQGSQEAAGPGAGGAETDPGEAAGRTPSGSDGLGGEEGAGAPPARPGGGEMAEAGSGEDSGEPENEATEPGGRAAGSFWEQYWEGARQRYRKRAARHKSGSAREGEWRHPLEKKAKLSEIVGPEESLAGSLWDSQTLRERKKETVAAESPEQLFRRPKFKFSIQSSKAGHLPSDTSFSIINELAKMGDPEVLEMVEEEGRSRPRGAGGGSGSRGTLQPGAQGYSPSGVSCARRGWGRGGGCKDPALGGWAPHDFLRGSCKPRPSSRDPLWFQDHLPFAPLCAQEPGGECWEAR